MTRYVPHIQHRREKTKSAGDINQEEEERQREQIHDLTAIAYYLQGMKIKKELFWSCTVTM